jgi:TetR/AcrR family transcriptional regulator, cholesterol catabolism regulator
MILMRRGIFDTKLGEWMSPNTAVARNGKSGLSSRRAERRRATEPRSHQRWLKIVAGAAAVFARVGYPAATLEEVAEEVGINRASLYYYVGTKAELLVEILHQPIFDMSETLQAIHDSDESPRTKLNLAIDAHMAALDTSYPELFVFLSDHLHVLTEGDPEGDVMANARRYGNLFTEIIEDGQRSGVIRNGIHPRIAMMAIVGMCNWTHRWYSADGPMGLREIGKDFAVVALDGLFLPDGSENGKKSSSARNNGKKPVAAGNGKKVATATTRATGRR